jgi:hypothetical protein
MAFKLLYIEDQHAESRAQDLMNSGFEVVTYDPSSDIRDVLAQISDDTSALVLDYRLTAGEKNACFDAPTIAQTLRSKHSHDANKRPEMPIVLMSNESVITDYYNDFTSQDLFDFTLTKKEFIEAQTRFAVKLNAFINGYKRIKNSGFDILQVLGIGSDEALLVHPNIKIKATKFDHHVFEYSRLVFEQIIRSIGPLVGEDILSARLGVSKESAGWPQLLETLTNAKYKGILSDAYSRWWMTKVNDWWSIFIKAEVPLRRLDAEERVELLTKRLGLDLIPLQKTEYSQSSNFWTICKLSNQPIDPFDGIELYKKDPLPWQEKEYLSIDTAMNHIDKFKNYISAIDRKAIRELSQKINSKK